MNQDAPKSHRGTIAQLALLLGVCIVVYWVGIGRFGLTASEGHRVVPAWEMLDAGQYFTPTLFDQIYLRKPPGMSWAVAASSTIFGQTEFAARAVSATASTGMALLAFYFAGRWFGKKWALAAGLAQALTPLFWLSGRTAEIEALNNFATQATVLLLLDMFMTRRARGTLMLGLLAGIAISAAALAKGPAAAPCLAGVLIAVCIVRRSLKPLINPGLLVAMALSTIIVSLITWMILDAVDQAGQTPVLQSVGHFMWDLSRIDKILLLGPTALLAAMPASLGLCFIWKRPAHPRSHSPNDQLDRYTMARALAWACIASLAIFTLAGIGNDRYAMPATVFLSPLAAYALWGLKEGFGPVGCKHAKRLWLGWPPVWGIILLVASAAYIGLLEPRKGLTSGRDAGFALGAHLPDGAHVHANDLVEARPEILAYASKAAAEDGRTVHLHWTIPGQELTLPPIGEFLVLRTDDLSGEAARYEQAGFMPRLEPITQGAAHKYTFTLFRVLGDTGE